MFQSDQDLRDEEFGHPFGQPALFVRKNHLEHVAFELFHDDEDSFGGFEHPFKVNHTRMGEVLEDGDFVLQLGFLLGWEPKFVDDFDSDRAGALAVDTAVDDSELPRPEDFVWEDLVDLAHVGYLFF